MSAEKTVLLGLCALLSGCGSVVGGDYRGELLYEISGQVYTDGIDFDGDVGVALVWSNGFREDLGSQSVVVETQFPARYTIRIYEPPDKTTVMPFLGDERITAAVGDIVLYEDIDSNGRWDRENEIIVGGAFGASLIWVDAVDDAFALEASAGPPPPDGQDPGFFEWTPEPGFNLVAREAPFSCVEPWDQWLVGLPEARADLEVSYFFPAVFDWDCDGQWGWDEPWDPGPYLNNECDPDLTVEWCAEMTTALEENIEEVFVAEQAAWLAEDDFARECLSDCTFVLEALFPEG